MKAWISDDTAVVWAPSAAKARAMVARYLLDHLGGSFGDYITSTRVRRAAEFDGDHPYRLFEHEPVDLGVMRGCAHPDQAAYWHDIDAYARELGRRYDAAMADVPEARR